jgi:hypothetical protein
MAGKKGCSGRKSWDKELEAKALWDLSIPVLKFALKSKSVKFNKKVEIALALVNKMIPTSPLVDNSKHTHITVKVEGIDGNKILPSRSAITSVQR